MMIAHQWQPITPLSEDCGYDFSEIDARQRRGTAVRRIFQEERPDAYQAFLDRLDRSGAIETGKIERLYILSEGTTKTLIARGLSADLIEHGSTNKDPQELVRILQDHVDAATGVYTAIKEGRPISRSAIREIHQVLTRNQPTYAAVDQFGKQFDAQLERGAFKKLPNNPTRRDGLIHEFCPPEQVDSELDNLLEWYHDYVQRPDRYHPLLTGAWLHHRFTQIHPFQDGNGRVVRTLLTWHLAREGYLPVVVKEADRVHYLAALETADAGNLRPFVELLTQLQSSAISEALDFALGEADPSEPVGLVDQILDNVVARIERGDAVRAAQLRAANTIAASLRDTAGATLETLGSQVATRLGDAGRTVVPEIINGGPEERGYWYRQQVIQTARKSGHWVNLNESRFFVRLALTPEPRYGQPRLVFVISLHHVGRRLSGVMAATAFATVERQPPDAAEYVAGADDPSFMDCTSEPFVFTGEDDPDSLTADFATWTQLQFAIALREWGEYLT